MFYKEMMKENSLSDFPSFYTELYELLNRIEYLTDNLDHNSQEYLDFMDELNRVSVQ